MRCSLLYCSFTPSWLQNRGKKRKREDRDAPVATVDRDWLILHTSGQRLLISSLLLALHPCPRVQGSSSEVFRAVVPPPPPFTVDQGTMRRRSVSDWCVMGSEILLILLLQVYRDCVLSSMVSALVSCWPSASGGLMPFRTASLSERPSIRGNSMKSYSTAPMAPPIMGPTQYTCKFEIRQS